MNDQERLESVLDQIKTEFRYMRSEIYDLEIKLRIAGDALEFYATEEVEILIGDNPAIEALYKIGRRK